MDFGTAEFLIFLVIVFTLYYLPLIRERQILLLVVASLVFYAWTAPILLGLLFLSIAISTVSSYVVVQGGGRQRVFAAALGVILNLALLAFFKYKYLFMGPATTETPDTRHGLLGSLLLLPLPIGISFYTFHGISLLVDCLRRKTAFMVERDARPVLAALARYGALPDFLPPADRRSDRQGETILSTDRTQAVRRH